jgi:hypothetical protein
MQRLVRCGALMALLLAFIVPTFATQTGDPAKQTGDDKKTDTKKDGDTKKKDAKEKFTYGGKYFGKITQLDQNSATKDFTLHVTGKVQEINQNEYNAMMNAMRQAQQHYQNAARATNVNNRNAELQRYQNSMNQAAQHQSRLYRVKDVNADYKFRVAENCIFRVLEPETEYDDKGNPVTFKKEDLERLKGKHKDFPGYEAQVDVVRNNAQVYVYTPKPKAKDTSTTKKKTDDDDQAVLPTDRQEVILIIVDNRKATTTQPGGK